MYVTSDLVCVMMILQFISGVFYFMTRDNTDWGDIPIMSSLASTILALLVATSVLGEFINSPGDQHVVFLGFALAYMIGFLVMGAYWLYSTSEFLYNKFVAKVL